MILKHCRWPSSANLFLTFSPTLDSDMALPLLLLNLLPLSCLYWLPPSAHPKSLFCRVSAIFPLLFPSPRSCGHSHSHLQLQLSLMIPDLYLSLPSLLSSRQQLATQHPCLSHQPVNSTCPLPDSVFLPKFASPPIFPSSVPEYLLGLGKEEGRGQHA